MSKDDWEKTQERLLADIEHFSRFGPRPGEVTATTPVVSTPAAQAASATPVNTQPPPASIANAPIPPAVTANAPPATPAAGEVANPAANSSLLAKLKQQAMAKLAAEDQKTSLRQEVMQQVSDALETTYKYLHDLSQQLNILHPDYQRVCSFYGVVDFDGLVWQEGRADFRLLPASSEDRLYDQVTLRYRLSNPRQIQLTRDNPAHEKLQKLLFDNGITFSTNEERNERGYVERATFTFPCEIKAGLQITGNYETGKLVLRTRNLDRFGVMEYQCEPAAINQDALDELARLILGEAHRLNQFFQRTA